MATYLRCHGDMTGLWQTDFYSNVDIKVFHCLKVTTYLVPSFIYGLAPSHMSLLHPRAVNRANLRSSEDDTVVETSYSQGTIARCMCEAWNALPIHLRNISKIEPFKTSLKTHYFIVVFE